MSAWYKRFRQRWTTCFFVALALSVVAIVEAQSNLDISGLGLFKNYNLEQRLTFLHGIESDEEVPLDSVLLEDSAYLILEETKDLGYLAPGIVGTFQNESGETMVEWGSDYEVQLPADYVAQSAEFVIRPGLQSHYETVQVEGVDAIDEERVHRYFVPEGFLLRQSASVFTYSGLDRRTGRLLQSLEALGYRSARLVSQDVTVDPDTAGVDVQLVIDQGPIYRVSSVRIDADSEGSDPFSREDDDAVGELYTSEWERSYRVDLRNAAFKVGYPDAKVRVRATRKDRTSDDLVEMDVAFELTRGERVRLDRVEFRGDPDTNTAVLHRKVDLKGSDWVNPLEVNEGQRELMSLGIFSEVNLSYDPESGESRSVVYDLVPGERKSLELLGGWGSYEQLRAGFKWRHLNPWGRAHRYEVEAKQSLKASRFESTYSIPYIFDTPLTAYTRAEYQFREEISYDRESKGVAVGTSWWLGRSGVRMSTEYGYKEEDADRDSNTNSSSQEQATIASVTVRATLDRRDDLLAPSSGYSLFSSYEWASEALGGSVNFQRVEVGGSYHFPLTKSILVHTGLRGGVILSTGASADNVPFNSRFFNGGENSVRGYREGQASPLDVNGDELGSESYVLFNFELEQRLSQSLSLVEFVDSIYFSQEGFYDAGDDFLYSIGFGIRYQTVVGPIRLEYGYNPEPRPQDSKGQLHLSVGFPF